MKKELWRRDNVSGRMWYVKCAETSAAIVGGIGCLRVKRADTSMQVNAAKSAEQNKIKTD